MRDLANVSDRWPRLRSTGDFDDLFGRFFESPWAIQDVDSKAFVPAVDVSENENEYRVKADIPGVKKEDLNVSVQDGILTINAESRYEDEEKKDGRLIRQERRYGKYSRSMRLGKDVDTTDVKAEYKDGVLELTLPKIEEVKPKKIAIDVN